MTKKEIVAAIAENNGITKKDAEEVMDACFETFKEALAEGEKITIPGFGSFTPKDVAARKGRNPQTGEEIEIAARVQVNFKAAAGLKEYVNS